MSSGAVGEHFDVVDRVQGDEIQIDSGAALKRRAAIDREIRRRMTTLAVDEDEHVVRTDAAQAGLQGLSGHVEAERLQLQGGHDLRQGRH